MKKALLPLAIVAVSTTAHAGTVITDGPDIKISTKGGLKAETTDGSASFRVGGRIQWDYDSTEADDYGIDREDFDVRRARLYVQGHIGDWAYKAQFNVAESDGADGGTAEDLYIRYTGFGKLANITLGKFKEPFGLEELTSSKDNPTLERTALTELYAPGRSGGLQVHGKGSNWTYAAGLFEAGADSSNDFDNKAVTARGTFAPIKTDDMVVHVGAGFTTRDADDSDDEVDAFNLEAAISTGPFHAQAEFFDAEFGDEDADGYYLQAGWVITGESRPYKDGVFKRIKPSSPNGAWEVVLRVEEGDGNYSDVGLGTTDGEQVTLGANYYVNEYVRFGASYMEGEDDAGGEGEEFRLRAQLVF